MSGIEYDTFARSGASEKRCRSGRHVWIDEVARERCCDPGWQKVLVQTHEWGTPAAAGIEYAGRSAVPGLDYGWAEARQAAAEPASNKPGAEPTAKPSEQSEVS